MPPNTVKVDRTTRWGNPHGPVGKPCQACGQVHTHQEAVDLYERETLPQIAEDARRLLAGKNLACWCSVGTPCHGDLLLAFVN